MTSPPTEVAPLSAAEEAEIALWQVVHDPTHNRDYYFNSVTQVTTWDMPTVLERKSQYEEYLNALSSWKKSQPKAMASSTKITPVNKEAATATAQMAQKGAIDSQGELPELDREKFAAMFAKWDTDRSNSIDDQELYEWMCSMNRHLPPTQKTATSLVQSHDTNGDGVLQKDELENWLSKGARMGAAKRTSLKQQSETFRHAMNFLERVVMSCAADTQSSNQSEPNTNGEQLEDLHASALNQVPETLAETRVDTPPNQAVGTVEKKKLQVNISMKKLKAEFDKHDSNRDLALDSLELMRWMATVKSGFHPDTSTVKALIAQHDTNGNGELCYDEFKVWMAKASTLSEEQRKIFSQRGRVAEQTMIFVESLLETCAL